MGQKALETSVHISTKSKHTKKKSPSGAGRLVGSRCSLKALGLSRGHQKSWKDTCPYYLLCTHVGVCLCECTCRPRSVQMLFLRNHSSCFWDSSSFFVIKLAKQAKHISSEFQRSRCHLLTTGITNTTTPGFGFVKWVLGTELWSSFRHSKDITELPL